LGEAEDFAKREVSASGENETNATSDPEAYKKVLLRVELDEAQELA
jgi:hypothetical protein